MIVIDMDMPKNCYVCELSDISACPIVHRRAAESGEGRLTDCPIKCDIEDIRAEIKAYSDKLELCKVAPSMEYVLQIIDKYR